MAIKKPKILHDDVDRMPYFAEKSDRYVLVRNGEEVFRGTHADCYTALLKRQSRSSAYALRFGGGNASTCRNWLRILPSRCCPAAAMHQRHLRPARRT
jgi:hypothetical protein